MSPVVTWSSLSVTSYHMFSLFRFKLKTVQGLSCSSASMLFQTACMNCWAMCWVELLEAIASKGAIAVEKERNGFIGILNLA
jgi:hypothetical protein